jgi:tetratricopeptide (TPR) repeat protein
MLVLCVASAAAAQSAWDWFIKGSKYGGKGRWEKGIKCLDKAIELDPKLALAYWSRGRYYLYLGRYNESIPDLTKAIELFAMEGSNEHLSGAYMSRAYSYKKLGRYDEARADWKKACDLGNVSGCDRLKELGN